MAEKTPSPYEVRLKAARLLIDAGFTPEEITLVFARDSGSGISLRTAYRWYTRVGERRRQKNHTASESN